MYANVRAYLSSNIESSGDYGILIVNIVDYNGDSVGPLYPTDSYPVANSVFWTGNNLLWYYYGDITAGSLNTNTSVSAASLFTVKGLFNLSFVEDSANFMLRQTMNGADGVYSSGRAQYDMATGMLADIGGEVYYEDKLLFGYNTAYDLQLQDKTSDTNNPSGENDDNNNLSTGAIVGIAIGGAVVLIVVVLGFYFYQRKRTSSQAAPTPQAFATPVEAPVNAKAAPQYHTDTTNPIASDVKIPAAQNPAYRGRISSASESQSYSPPRNSSMEGSKRTVSVPENVEPNL